MLEHPMITKINKTGYPENMGNQPEHNGIDAMGDEILTGDEIVIDNERGEVILKDNLNDYLAEMYGFLFTTAD